MYSDNRWESVTAGRVYPKPRDGRYTRWCKWCGMDVTTDRPWQEHRDSLAGGRHAIDPEAHKPLTVGAVLQSKSKPKRTKQPSVRTMTRWMVDGVARATDGCRVEPDGQCEHGCQSWLLELGYI